MSKVAISPTISPFGHRPGTLRACAHCAAIRVGWITDDEPPYLTELGETMWKAMEPQYVVDFYEQARRVECR